MGESQIVKLLVNHKACGFSSDTGEGVGCVCVEGWRGMRGSKHRSDYLFLKDHSGYCVETRFQEGTSRSRKKT